MTDESGWQFALDAAGMGTWELDVATGNMRRSQRHDQIFGYDTFQQRWNTTRALAHFLPEDRQLLKHALAEARLTGASISRPASSAPSDHEIRWLHIRGQTFYSERDAAIRIAGVISDVTERRGVEERLREAQRIEALGQLTGGVAHDFNNLLQVIFSGLQVIAHASEPARRERVAASMKRAVEHGAGLCRQLLAFSRRQPLRLEPVDLARLIGGMREMLGRSLRGNVTVKMEFAQRLWPVEVDAGEMELVLLNLALNARDAMPAGGSITIRAFNMPALGDHELSGDYVRVDVIDNGVGMTPEVLAHASSRSSRPRRSARGRDSVSPRRMDSHARPAGAVRIHSAPRRRHDGVALSAADPQAAADPRRCLRRAGGGARPRRPRLKCWWWRTMTRSRH